MMTGERGFTLIEILSSLAIFAGVVVGALGVLAPRDPAGPPKAPTVRHAAMRPHRYLQDV